MPGPFHRRLVNLHEHLVILFRGVLQFVLPPRLSAHFIHFFAVAPGPLEIQNPHRFKAGASPSISGTAESLFSDKLFPFRSWFSTKIEKTPG